MLFLSSSTVSMAADNGTLLIRGYFMNRILIVEDELKLARLEADYLHNAVMQQIALMKVLKYYRG